MFKKIYLLAVLLSAASITIADTVTLNPDHPDEYVVVKGDTLWDISEQFLQDPWRWPSVWQRNPQVENPHLIYPGDVISLIFRDGQPVLTVNGSGSEAGSEADTRPGSGSVSVVDGRHVKLSPAIRSRERDEAIQSIPVDAIQQFLTRPRIVTENEMADWPYVVSSYDEHMVAGSGDKLYVKGLAEDAGVSRYGLYRKGPAYINPRKDKDKVLGYEALYLGDVVIVQQGDPASAIVADSKQEILNGDRLAIESEADARHEFIPSTPNGDIDANILSVINGVAQIGQYQVVVVDVGDNDGVEVGNVLGIYQSGKIVKDQVATDQKAKEVSALVEYLGRPNVRPELVELPAEYAGVLMVFRTFEEVSYGLIMKAVSPIHVLDSVRNL